MQYQKGPSTFGDSAGDWAVILRQFPHMQKQTKVHVWSTGGFTWSSYKQRSSHNYKDNNFLAHIHSCARHPQLFLSLIHASTSHLKKNQAIHASNFKNTQAHLSLFVRDTSSLNSFASLPCSHFSTTPPISNPSQTHINNIIYLLSSLNLK